MKRLTGYFIIFIYAACLLITLSARSQVIINPEAGSPGPKGQTEVRFYYIPDLEIYYDIQTANYIYSNGTRWISSDALPVKYAYYDLNTGHKVMLYDYTGDKPQTLFNSHRSKYPKGYKGPPPEASPKGKFKEEGKPASDLYKIEKAPAKKVKKK